jgi:2-polyprenyl-3-methyl-5-hydroxy-6-metoxy-1,4-benzoquinol methylase
MMTAFEQTAALCAAIGLGLFSAIAQGSQTVEALSVACGAASRGVRILSDILVVHGLLTKEDGLYGLTPEAAAFLDAAQPTYIGGAAQFLASPEKIALYFDDPVGWARRGGPRDRANTTPESRVWVDFARGMAAFMRPVAESLAETLSASGPPAMRVLDVAAGHGLFGVEIALRRPDAHITALDWAAVLEVALETARAAGVEDRFSTRPGSAFDTDLGGPYDLILVPNFLHHFDPQTCVAFLENVAASLAAGGAAAIVEYTPDATRVAPPVPALFALSMLTGTPSGDAYTAEELAQMCHQADLQDVAIAPLAQTQQTLLLARRTGPGAKPGRVPLT